MRYAGSKALASRSIVQFLPSGQGLHYVEPFCGLAYVFQRLRRQGETFASWSLSDLNAPLVSWWQSIGGSETEFNALVERIEDARSKWLPECHYYREIMGEFNRCIERLRTEPPCPYSFFFAHCYAFGQLVSVRTRPSVASFSDRYVGFGIGRYSALELERMRDIFLPAKLERKCALDVLYELAERDDASSYFVYLDPPYIPDDDDADDNRIYDHEFCRDQHLELNELLRVAPFRFAMSIGSNATSDALYVYDESFHTPFRRNGFAAYTIPSQCSGRRSGWTEHSYTDVEWLILNYNPYEY